MKKITISSKLRNYEVQFINDIRSQIKKESKEDIFIIDKFINSKIKLNRKKIIISPSEIEKNFSKLQNVIQKLLNLGITRDTKIICVGGGVVQDISSFLSSIIFRGINWYFYPTTIISQCDSCIGGKTAINYRGIINSVGNYFHPKIVFIVNKIIQKIPEREYRSGIPEILKCGLISKNKILNLLENKKELI